MVCAARAHGRVPAAGRGPRSAAIKVNQCCAGLKARRRGGAGRAGRGRAGRPPAAVRARSPRRAHPCSVVRAVSAVSAVSRAVSAVRAVARAACVRRARPGGARRCADPMRRARCPRRSPLLLALALACLLRVRPIHTLNYIPHQRTLQMLLILLTKVFFKLRVFLGT